MDDTQFEVVQQESRKVKEDILEVLDEVDTIQLEVSKLSQNRLVRGKPVGQWDRELLMEIDYAADPVQIKMALEKVNKSLNTVIKNLIATKQDRMYFNIHYNKGLRTNIDSEAAKKGRKLPSLVTMETLAQNAMGGKTTVKEQYEHEIDFWEIYERKLYKQIQLLNQMAMNNGTMVKMER